MRTGEHVAKEMTMGNYFKMIYEERLSRPKWGRAQKHASKCRSIALFC